MTSDLATLYLDEVFRSLRGHKRLADDAIAQLSDEQFFALPDPESNSIAIIVKHMSGNMRSRFTDFLTSDGEKPDRNRDQEFILRNTPRARRCCAHGSSNGSWSATPSIRCSRTISTAPSPFAASRTRCCKR